MHFSLPHLFVMFDILSVAVFVIGNRFRKKADLCLNLYLCVIKYYLITDSHSLSLCIFLLLFTGQTK